MKVKMFIALAYLVILFPPFCRAQSGWITIPAVAFNCRSTAGDWGFFIGAEHYLQILSSNETNFVAPVVFPPDAQGLKVTELNATVYDNNPDSFIEVSLFRVNRYEGIRQDVFHETTSPSESTPGKTRIVDKTGGNRLIDNEKFAWYIHFSVSLNFHYTNQRLYCVRIRYQ